MKQFYNPNELDYSCLIEFLNEIDDTFNDDPLHESPAHFGFRFEVVESKTKIEIIQYGKYYRNFSITITLDGDNNLIESFLRAFNLALSHYTVVGDIAKKSNGLSIEKAVYEYSNIFEHAKRFEKRLYQLHRRAEELYKNKKGYYDYLQRNVVRGQKA